LLPLLSGLSRAELSSLLSYRVCRVYWVYRKIKGKGWRKKEWPFDLEQHGCYDFA